jgi:hypothetical protein
MFAHLDGHHGRHSVSVVGSSHHYSINVLFFLEHFAEIAVPAGVWKLLERLAGLLIIHIAQRDYIFTCDRPDIPRAFAAHADTGYIELFTGRRLSGPSEHMSRHYRKSRHGRGAAHKLPAGDPCMILIGISFLFFHSLLP